MTIKNIKKWNNDFENRKNSHYFIKVHMYIFRIRDLES